MPPRTPQEHRSLHCLQANVGVTVATTAPVRPTLQAETTALTWVAHVMHDGGQDDCQQLQICQLVAEPVGCQEGSHRLRHVSCVHAVVVWLVIVGGLNLLQGMHMAAGPWQRPPARK